MRELPARQVRVLSKGVVNLKQRHWGEWCSPVPETLFPRGLLSAFFRTYPRWQREGPAAELVMGNPNYELLQEKQRDDAFGHSAHRELAWRIGPDYSESRCDGPRNKDALLDSR